MPTPNTRIKSIPKKLLGKDEQDIFCTKSNCLGTLVPQQKYSRKKGKVPRITLKCSDCEAIIIINTE